MIQLYRTDGKEVEKSLRRVERLLSTVFIQQFFFSGLWEDDNFMWTAPGTLFIFI